MCGRFAQFSPPHQYAAAIGPDLFSVNEPTEHYNIAPSTLVSVFHLQNGVLRDTLVPWGWRPHWAMARGPSINARIETVSSKPFFRPIWSSGRCIVGADGWYEWKKNPGDHKRKQPYFIRLKGGGPILFAALGKFPKEIGVPEDGTGFVILTGNADAGLVDVHDRKPLVLSPDFAKSWLSPGTSPDEALHIAEHQELPAEAFEWFPVGKEVGNVKSQGAHLIAPIAMPLL